MSHRLSFNNDNINAYLNHHGHTPASSQSYKDLASLVSSDHDFRVPPLTPALVAEPNQRAARARYQSHPQRKLYMPLNAQTASPASKSPIANEKTTDNLPPTPARSKRADTTKPRPTKCENESCRKPSISDTDEEPGHGPNGIALCRRCYRRYKLEKKHAKAEERKVTDAWKTPRRKSDVVRNEQLIEAKRSPERPKAQQSRPKSYQSATSSVEPSTTASTVTSTATSSIPGLSRLSPSQTSEFTWSDLEKGLRSKSPMGPRAPTPKLKELDEKGESPEPARASSYEEAEYFKYGRMEEEYRRPRHLRLNCNCGVLSDWSPRRKYIVLGGSASVVVLIIILIAVAVTQSHKGFRYIASQAQVINAAAFDSGGATHADVSNTADGKAMAQDVYTYYSGYSSNFPTFDSWISFDQMWVNNLEIMQKSCGRLGQGEDNSPEIMQDMHDAIQDRANASLVDHRIVLAVILQESKGCVRVGATTSSGGVRNPGLMQSHNGHSYDRKASRLSIFAMVQDGTQGTADGDGLVQTLNIYGDPYKAMRAYNSGHIPPSGNLSEAAGATACYVSDVANRLTGWVNAASKCQE